MSDKPTLELIEKLISFDTTSRNSNLDLIRFIEEYLSSHGIESTRVLDEAGGKANLYATLGDPTMSGIMLSGHTDVVPVDGQDWSTDPFTLTTKGDKLYGRGTSDMKSFIALALAYVPKFLARGLHTPIHLAFSYDEEIGCIGVRRMIDMINTLPVKPRMAIVGEPTSMGVIVGHKGKRSYSAHVRGLEAHSSLAPQGVNAIQYAAELITHLTSMARRIQENGPFDELYDVSHTTVHTGVINGGTALNIVPKDCRFDFEFRYVGDDDPDAIEAEIREFTAQNIEPRMRKISRDTGIDITCINDMPGLNLNADEEVVTFVKALAGKNDHAKVAFGTEAGLFHTTAGVPTVICGPGSIEQAHKPDEYIELSQLQEAAAFMDRLVDKVCKV
ncbi:MAG: acetylornithine deacetylase [Rhodospirillales bacterium]|nr:acetylornithine deacetylase [Rhodospirillales bacterium]